MDTMITEKILHSFLQCKYKGYLKHIGESGTKSDYEILIQELNEEYKRTATNKVIASHDGSKILWNPLVTPSILKQGATIIVNPMLQIGAFSLRIDALIKVSTASQLGQYHYVPMLFHKGEKIHEEQKRLIALFGIALGDLQGRRPDKGLVIYGEEYRTTTIHLDSRFKEAALVFEEIREMQQNGAAPKLMLNEHCRICEFQQRCKIEATKKDDISLLRGMSQKEIRKNNRRGIFTTTQLSCRFRPRKKGKRVKKLTQSHYFALQALAIREKKIHVFGIPELPASNVRIYLDVEGDSERSFVYLIGLIVDDNGVEKQYSLWAADNTQELQIFQQFLDIVGQYENFCMYYYGSYEAAFLRRMRKQAKRKKPVDTVIKNSLNVLSIIYSNIYFPTYSNELKEIGQYLGLTWTEEKASGVQSIVWRKRWEITRDDELKYKLIKYNIEDCIALKRITECIYEISIKDSASSSSPLSDGKNPEVVFTKDMSPQTSRREWGRAKFFHDDFAYINKCAYFDYQRDKVFFRASKAFRKTLSRKRQTNKKKKLKINKSIEIKSFTCPFCKGRNITRNYDNMHTKLAFDLKISSGGMKRQVIECTTAHHLCNECHKHFLPRRYKKRDKHFHNLKCWAMYQHMAHRVSFENLEETFKECFGLHILSTEFHMFKSLLARYYNATYKALIKKIVSGDIVHADETEVNLKQEKGYVWVFTNLEEVVFMYKPTREGEFVKEMLRDFNGVLISDFYGAYDSIPCEQQKCLIHLLRDFNHDVLDNAYDEELKLIASDFGRLLRDIISTIDKYGLKCRHLNKHAKDVERFYKVLDGGHYNSELAEKYQKKLIKYRDKLFTFLKYDGVPWNNNNAEHAIRHFADYRMITNGKMTESGINSYLVLLSIYQTCKYKGVSFLKFLLSRERDIDRFCESRTAKQAAPILDTYPKGFPRIRPPYRKQNSNLDEETPEVKP